jgi:hypothetical protein
MQCVVSRTRRVLDLIMLAALRAVAPAVETPVPPGQEARITAAVTLSLNQARVVRITLFRASLSQKRLQLVLMKILLLVVGFTAIKLRSLSAAWSE